MIPLCTTATLPEICGCAFSSVGLPWVAQRVCAIPSEPEICDVFTASARLITLPTRRSRSTWPALINAKPAES